MSEVFTVRCEMCHRPMKHATPSGMGPVCAKKAAVDRVSGQLWFDLEEACIAARVRIAAHIESMVLDLRAWVRSWRT